MLDELLIQDKICLLRSRAADHLYKILRMNHLGKGLFDSSGGEFIVCLSGAARLMCAWDTRPEDVAAFLDDAAEVAK